MKRGIIVAIIAVCGIFLGSIIISHSSSNNDGKLLISRGNEDISSFFQFTPQNPSERYVALPEYIASSSDIHLPEPEGDNLTDQLAYLFTSQLSQGVSSPDIAAENAYRSMAGELTYDFFDESDVVAKSDNTITSQIQYLESYARIINQHLKNINTNNVANELSKFESGSTDGLATLLEPIPSILNELLILKVPSEWAPVHVELLNLWERKKIVYENIINYEEDPLKAMFSLEELTGLVELEETMHETLEEYYETLLS